MKNAKLISICFFLAALIVMLPVCFADEIRTTEGVTLAKNSDSAKDQKNSKVASAQAASVVDTFPGLAAWLVALISPFVTYIAIGAAVIAAGYVIYRVAYSTWTYYTAYSYSKLSEHAYNHINDFQNIWKKTPSRKNFEKKCKDNMNSKSVERYLDTVNGESIAFNPSTEMMTVGKVDGKTIDTCTRYKRSDVDKKVNSGKWKSVN